MRIGIIGAMDLEVKALREMMTISHTVRKAGTEFFAGQLGTAEAVVVRSGVGKVNAGLCVQVLVDEFSVTQIINIGVAGALNPDLQIGDVVISADALQHDMDASLLGFARGEIPYMGRATFDADHNLRRAAMIAAHEVLPDLRVIEGRVISGDQFIASPEKKAQLVADFQGDCTEMEGAAVAQACALNDIPFLIVRAVSDKADGSGKVNFEEFAAKSAANASALVKRIIALL